MDFTAHAPFIPLIEDKSFSLKKQTGMREEGGRRLLIVQLI